MMEKETRERREGVIRAEKTQARYEEDDFLEANATDKDDDS